MKRIDSFYFLITTAGNLLIFTWVSWFNPLIVKSWGPLGSSLPMLSLWALRMRYFFILIAVISLVLMVLSFMKKLPDKVLTLVIFVIFLSDVACLLVATFGYSLPFVSYVPVID